MGTTVTKIWPLLLSVLLPRDDVSSSDTCFESTWRGAACSYVICSVSNHMGSLWDLDDGSTRWDRRYSIIIELSVVTVQLQSARNQPVTASWLGTLHRNAWFSYRTPRIIDVPERFRDLMISSKLLGELWAFHFTHNLRTAIGKKLVDHFASKRWLCDMRCIPLSGLPWPIKLRRACFCLGTVHFKD